MITQYPGETDFDLEKQIKNVTAILKYYNPTL